MRAEVLVQAAVIIMAVSVLILNLIIDLSYARICIGVEPSGGDRLKP